MKRDVLLRLSRGGATLFGALRPHIPPGREKCTLRLTSHRRFVVGVFSNVVNRERLRNASSNLKEKSGKYEHLHDVEQGRNETHFSVISLRLFNICYGAYNTNINTPPPPPHNFTLFFSFGAINSVESFKINFPGKIHCSVTFRANFFLFPFPPISNYIEEKVGGALNIDVA